MDEQQEVVEGQAIARAVNDVLNRSESADWTAFHDTYYRQLLCVAEREYAPAPHSAGTTIVQRNWCRASWQSASIRKIGRGARRALPRRGKDRCGRDWPQVLATSAWTWSARSLHRFVNGGTNSRWRPLLRDNVERLTCRICDSYFRNKCRRFGRTSRRAGIVVRPIARPSFSAFVWTGSGALRGR